MSHEEQYWKRKYEQEESDTSLKNFLNFALKTSVGCALTMLGCGTVFVVVKTIKFIF